MKKIILLFILLYQLQLFGQVENDYRSKSNGTWTSVSSWEIYDGTTWNSATKYPGETTGNVETVTIQSGNTITINTNNAACNELIVAGTLQFQSGQSNRTLVVNGDVTINSGGEFISLGTITNRNRGLTVGGNLTVNGSFDMNTSGTSPVRFVNSSTASISGAGTSCAFHVLTCDKGTDMTNFLSVDREITIKDASSQTLFITNGTFKINQPGTFILYGNNRTICESTGRLWLNHAEVSIGWNTTSGNGTVYGDLIIDAGNFSCPGRLTIEGTSTGNNRINNATLTTGGSFDVEQDLTISTSTISVGDDFIIDHNDTDEYGDVSVTASNITVSDITHVIGTFKYREGTFVTGDNSGNDLQVYSDTYGHGTIDFENVDFTVNGTFYIQGNATEQNRMVNCRGTIKSDLNISQDLIISDFTSTLEIGDDFIINNDGSTTFSDVSVTNTDISVSDRTYTYGNFSNTNGTFLTGSNSGYDLYVLNGGTIDFEDVDFTVSGTLRIAGGATDQNSLTNCSGTITSDLNISQDLIISDFSSTLEIGDDFLIYNNGSTTFSDVSVTNTDIAVADYTQTYGYFKYTNGTFSTGNSGTDTEFDVTTGGTLNFENIDFNVNGTFLIRDAATDNNKLINCSGSITNDLNIYGSLEINGAPSTITIGGDIFIRNTGTILSVTDADITANDILQISGGGIFNHYNQTVSIGSYVDLQSYGEYHNYGGTLNMGDGDDYIHVRTGSVFELTDNSSTVNCYGRYYHDNATNYFTMTAGNFNIDPRRSDVGGTDLSANDVCYFPTNTVVNFTGGTLTFVDPNVNSTNWNQCDLQIDYQTNKTFGPNSTIVFGTGGTTPGHPTNDYHDFVFIFRRSGTTGGTIGNLVINNPDAAENKRTVHIYDWGYIDLTIENLTITDGILEIDNGGDGTIMTVQGDFVNNGYLEATDPDNQLIFNSSYVQEYSGTGSVSTTLAQLTLNNSSSTGITLSATLGAIDVNMADGNIYTSSGGLLTVYGTDPSNLYGYSSDNYVVGPLCRAIPEDASAFDYEFPVGSETNYRLTEVFGVSTSGSGTGFITSEFLEATIEPATGGTAMENPLNSLDIYWKFTYSLNSVSLDNVGSARFLYTVPDSPPVYGLAQSVTGLNGTYNAIGRVISGNTIQSENYDLADITPTSETYITIAEVEPLRGTYYVGNYDASIETDTEIFFNNLTEVAAILNEKYVDDNVIFEILDTYDDDTETIPIVFNKLMLTEPAYDVTIYPRAGVTGTVTERDGNTDDEAMIIIDGINALTFNGRPGGTETADWTFSNTRTSNPGPVFEFRNDANSNTLSNLTLKSDVNYDLSNIQGVITFGESTSSLGNSNNLIEYCEITGYSSTPAIGIASVGTSGAANSENVIDNCKIHDCFNGSLDNGAIYIGENSTGWDITNNLVYQTAARTFNGGYTYYGIYIENTESSDFTIDNNIIGYSTDNQTGYTEISGSTGEFCGIRYSGAEDTDGSVTEITNNTISGIKYSTSSTNTVNGFFNGIWMESGDANIGTSGNGNIIGSSETFTGYPIQVENLTENGQIITIYISSSRPVQVTDNQIGGFSVTEDNYIYFIGIQTNGSGSNAEFLIQNNTIGSTTQSNSIKLGEIGYNDNNWLYGIYNYSAGNIEISGNTIANMTSYFDLQGSYGVRGIYSGSSHSYDITISNNIIYNLSCYSNVSWREGINSSVIGISVYDWDSDPSTITGNEIYGLGNINPDNAYNCVTGISSGGNSTDIINGNFVHNLYSESENGRLCGIYIYNGEVTVTNNMIQLGFDPDGNSITNPSRIFGIHHTSDEVCSFYHNSVYIGGDGVTTANNIITTAFYYDDDVICDIQNNIFVNNRSNASGETSKHYDYYIDFDEVITIDYNIYSAKGTGGYLAYFDDNDFSSLREIQAYTNYENMHSAQGDPLFENPEGDSETVDLHLSSTNPSPAEGTGIDGLGIDYDIDREERTSGSPVDIGADAGIYSFDTTVDIFAPTFEYTKIVAQICGTTSVDIDVTIEDQGVGLPLSGSYLPRIYYRDNNEDWATANSVQGVLQSGDGNNGVWRFTLTGLSDGTIYEYYVAAQDKADSPVVGYSKFNEDTPVLTDVNTVVTAPDNDMDIDAFGVCVTSGGEYTVGNTTDCPTCDFETITGTFGLFYEINSTSVIDNITARVVADTDEPGTYGLYNFDNTATGIYTVSLVPYNAYDKTISAASTINRTAIRLEGANRFKVNGQYEGDGNRHLHFEHEKNDQPVFSLSEGATNNTISYSEIRGSSSLDPRGTIFFADATRPLATTGNNYNTISNNLITKGDQTPYNAIFSLRSDGILNEGNTILNNQISDFQHNGIWLREDGTGDSWTITGNTMFNTIVSDEAQSAVNIEAGNAHKIMNNRIGGNAPDNSGIWENNGTSNDDLSLITLDIDDVSVTYVSNNTFKNIYASGTWGTSVWGIQIQDGLVDVTGNSMSYITTDRSSAIYGIYHRGTSPVIITDNTISDISKTSSNDFRGIYVYTDNADVGNIENNVIKGISVTSTNNNVNFDGIYLANGECNINNNRIGGNNAADNIELYCGNVVCGIRIEGNDFEHEISGNQIINIDFHGNNIFRAIYLYQTATNQVITAENNTIDNIRLYDTSSDTRFSGFSIYDGQYILQNNTIGTSAYGIKNSGTGSTYAIYNTSNTHDSNISDNNITNISGGGYTYGIYSDEDRRLEISENNITGITISNDIIFTGIKVTDGINAIQGNKINDISLTNTGSGTYFGGLWISGGTNTIGTTSANTIGTVSNPISCNGTASYGIHVDGGSNTIQNNPISCISGSQTTSGFEINGGNSDLVENTITHISASENINGFEVTGGTADINNNTITEISSTDNIKICGITQTAGTVNADGNTISSIELTNTGSNTAFYGIRTTGGTLNAGQTTGNTIGHSSDDDAISCAGIRTVGVYVGSSSDCSVENNLVANLTSVNTSSNGVISGIEVANSGDHTVSDNIIRDLTTSGTNTSYSSGEVVAQGVFVSGSSASVISNNTIYNISATASAATHVAGLTENSEAVVFNRNKIYNLSNNSSGTVNGIILTNIGSYGYAANHFISLGDDDNTEYRGIWIAADNANTKQVYFNSVYIGGTSTGADSYAFLRSNVTVPLYLRNNIFSNFRTGSGSHYAIASENVSDWTEDFVLANCYYSSETSTVGLWGSTTVDYADWITNTGENDLLLSTDEEPPFMDAISCNLHIDPVNACSFNSIAEAVSAITEDWDGESRPPHSDIGADEFYPTGGNDYDIWRGWTDSDWNTEGNWQCEQQPLITSDIVVLDTGNDPVIDSDVQCNELEIYTDADLTVNPGSSLKLTGELTFNGNLTLLSTSAGTGSFIDNGSITGSGTAYVERYLNPNAWHYISSPVQNASNKIVTEDLYYPWYNSNLIIYNENFAGTDWNDGWEWPYLEAVDGNLEVTRGYGAYCADSQSKTIQFVSDADELNTGDYSISITNTDETAETVTGNGILSRGWNLIGNPYPSHIDANNFISENSSIIDGALYFWDEEGGSGFDEKGEDYAVWNGSGSVGTGSGSYTPNGIISSGQSFFVHKTNDGTSTVNFTNSMRINTNAHFYKSGSTIQRFFITVTNPEDYSNETLIALTDDATDEFDSYYDAYKMTGNSELALYSLLQNEAFVIQALESIKKKDKTIPLGVHTSVTGSHTISLEETENSDLQIYLEDMQTDTIVNLRSSDYMFAVYEESTINDRFVIRFTPNNSPETNDEIPDQVINEDKEYKYTVPGNLFTDEDEQDELQYSAVLKNGDPLPDWLMFDNETLSFTGTPANEDVEKYSVRLYATDLISEFAYDEFELTVNNVNDPPQVVSYVPGTLITEDVEFSFRIDSAVFHDPDVDDQLTFTAYNDFDELPKWLNFDPETLTFSGIIDETDTEMLDIHINATDLAGESCSLSFNINIQQVDDIPEATAIEDQTAVVDTLFNFIVPANTFTDSDTDDTLIVRLISDLPEWLTFDSINRKFSGTPGLSDIGEVSVTLQANDLANHSATTYFIIYVVKLNHSPVLVKPIEDKYVQKDTYFSFTINKNVFSDPDADDQLTYSMSLTDGSLLPEWLSFNNDELSISGTPPQQDTIEIMLSATDLAGEISSDSFTVYVIANTAIENTEADYQGICIYPNPSDGHFYIIANDDYDIAIRDISGKTILLHYKIGKYDSIDVSYLNKGIYFIEFTSDNITTIKKFVVGE